MSTMHMLREVKHAMKTSTWGENTAATVRLQQFINCKQLIQSQTAAIIIKGLDQKIFMYHDISNFIYLN